MLPELKHFNFHLLVYYLIKDWIKDTDKRPDKKAHKDKYVWTDSASHALSWLAFFPFPARAYQYGNLMKAILWDF